MENQPGVWLALVKRSENEQGHTEREKREKRERKCLEGQRVSRGKREREGGREQQQRSLSNEEPKQRERERERDFSSESKKANTPAAGNDVIQSSNILMTIPVL